MRDNKFILKIYQSPQTVLSVAEIGILLGKTDADNLKSQIQYHVKKGVLMKLRKGIYAKPNFNIFELGTKIFSPAYVSLQTVLQQEGVIFQDYSRIFLVSYLTRTINIKNQAFEFHRIKKEILINPLGLIQKNNFWQSSKERAICDTLYVFGNFYFDNLRSVDWEKTREIAKIYNNRTLISKLEKLYHSESSNN